MTTDDMEKRVLQLFDAAQDIPSDVRADWLREQAGEDTALLARLEGLLAADAAAANVLRTGGAKQAFEDEVGTVKRAGAYRVTDLIGRGGMGDVYKGQRDQGDFEHEVAIKVIKPGLLSKSVEARLKAERQILADLNHPNIARLFDGGELEDGSPYIIMEYIEGEPVTHWVEAQKLSLPDRLWLFCDLCRAVQYAHQNLIVHRDITPSNVLVTKEGVIKLIDFGIAKPQDVFVDTGQDLQMPSSEFVGSKPSLASFSFTPGYAAPERAEGAKPNILSDIFSLGKLLAHIIPDGRIKRDLRAIVSKATEANPAERYVSVDNLRDEVVRYLNDYPVEAVHGGGGYRFSKFFKRRWLTVTGVSAVAAGLVGGLAVTTGLYKEAEVARVEADGRFEDVRELANFMLFDLYDELEVVPGNTKAMSKLADEAQAYLEVLSKSGRADLNLQLEAASGLNRVANILGSPAQKSLGRRAESRAVFKSSYDRLKALYKENPDNPDITRALAQSAFDNNVFQYIAEDISETSFAFAEESVRLYDALLALDNNEADRIARVLSAISAARPLIYMEREDESLSRYDALEGEVMALVSTAEDEVAAMRMAASYYAERGNSTTLYVANTLKRAAANGEEETEGDYTLAIEHLLKAIEYLEVINERDADNVASNLDQLGKTYFRLGLAYAWAKEHQSSEEVLVKSEDYFNALLRNDPENRQALRLVIAVRTQRAQALWRLSRVEESIAINEEIITIYQELREAEPDSAGHVRDFGSAYLLAGNAYAEAGDFREMCNKFNLGRLQFIELEERFGIVESDRRAFLDPLTANVQRCKDEGLLEID